MGVRVWATTVGVTTFDLVSGAVGVTVAEPVVEAERTPVTMVAVAVELKETAETEGKAEMDGETVEDWELDAELVSLSEVVLDLEVIIVYECV